MTGRGDGSGADERARAALARLTENERDCLRRRLLPQTAKEMAIDLGISPHAVEKRLKMARAKLGVTSSLHAARLLAAAEGYMPMVPVPADLPDQETERQDRAAAPDVPRRRRIPPAAFVLGAISMILVAAVLVLVPQAGPTPAIPASAGKDDVVLILPKGAPGPHIAGRPAPENAKDMAMRSAGPEEVAAFARSSFGTMDKDGSGFIELREAPVAGIGIDDAKTGRRTRARNATVSWPIGPHAQAMWIALMDGDHDGRVSAAEYVSYEGRVWRDHVPANWAWRR